MSKNSKILIVDDESTARQLLEAILYPENFELFFAETGKEAFNKAIDLIPDLILMDVMMPDMDGFEVCKKLRTHKLLGNVPIILITALDDRDSMIKGLDAGADDYIAKPFDRIEVLTKVKNIAQLNRYKRILLESEKPESKYKGPAIRDKSVHYTSLIQKLLLPSGEYLKKILPHHFMIIHNLTVLSSNIIRIWEKNNNMVFLFCIKRFKDISDVLMNILCITQIGNIVYEREKLNAGEILDEFMADMKRNNLITGEWLTSPDNLSFALCILNKERPEMQYSGYNIPLFIISDKTGKKIEPVIKSGDKQYQNNFTNIEINLKKNDSFYIFSSNLIKYFEEDYQMITNKDLIKVLEELQKYNIKEQENFFSAFIEKTTTESKKLEDIILMGVKV